MTKYDPKEIRAFITRFAKAEEAFTSGCCYWFAHILNARFPGPETAITLAVVPNHFVTRIDGRLYDVTGDVTDKFEDETLIDWDKMERYDEKQRDRVLRDCVMFTQNVNTVPSLDVLESKYGFVSAGKPALTYVLMALPTPVHGPAFARYGPDCVGAYGARVLDEQDYPTGIINLIVWENPASFDAGMPPMAVLDMPGLTEAKPTGKEKNE